MIRTTIRAALVCLATTATLVVHSALSNRCVSLTQDTNGRSVANDLIESITTKYNDDDFKGIYDLASELSRRTSVKRSLFGS